MSRAIEIARYLLWLAQQEPEPIPLTQMHLHKLLYYVQGWSLGVRGGSAFDGSIQAWKHGPVVREVYPVFASYGNSPIDARQARGFESLSPDDRAFVNGVWKRYRKFSASGLRTKTHRELPWLNARGDLPEGASCDVEITRDALRLFFSNEARRLNWPGLAPADVERNVLDLSEGRGIPLRDAERRWSDAI